MPNQKRVLIVEGDVHIAELLRMNLRDEGYISKHVTDGYAGVQVLEQERWDALVLDLSQPGVDGLELCRRVRAMNRYTPMIITSAGSNEILRILELELDADDYLAKPFSMRELVARVTAIFRRTDALSRDAALRSGSIDMEGLRINPASREVEVDGKFVDLTPKEFDLLHFFTRNPGTLYTRLELLSLVWGYRHGGYEHTVNTHVSRLRLKIEKQPASPRRILTVWGKGYKFAAPMQTAREKS